MVKFTNKAKGRPSKRRTFKVKYKIEKKVKQHNKRVKKQARKLKGKGLKHKGEARCDYLPNMFPFKQQILQQARKTLPQAIVHEKLSLDQSEYGLINLENKPAYLPKAKDNLIKKYVTNLEKLLDNVSIVLELLEIRDPIACIDKSFRAKCGQKNIKIISILTKADTIKQPLISKIEASVLAKCDKVLRSSTDHKLKSAAFDSIVEALKDSGVSGNVLVAGKSLTGKHAFITYFTKHVGKYNESPYELNLIKITPNIQLIDSPYKLEDTTGYPLFHTPSPILEESLFSQEEAIVKKLFFKSEDKKELIKHDSILEHFGIQDYTTVSDFLNKVGKTWKVFGKGGNVDTNRVRAKILTEWYNGKLNHLLHH